MASTRSKSSTKTAAQTLMSIRYGYGTKFNATKSNASRFENNWTNWYDAFVQEVRDEGYSPAEIEREAESRWATFCAKTLKCDESHIRSWLARNDI